MKQKKETIIRLFLGLFFVFLFSVLLFIDAEPITAWISTLENLEYDLRVRKIYKPLDKNNVIMLIDIDDKSLKAEGRWPWPRKMMANLITNLYQKGAVLVALDVIFSEAEKNIIDEVIKVTPKLTSQLEEYRETFDNDLILAKSLKLGDSILGMVFTNEGENSGLLPTPIFQLTPEMAEKLDIPNKKDYLANISVLAQAAKMQGFINESPDPDGISRFAPLLFREGINVYGSLSLQVAALYLLTKNIDLVTKKYEDATVLEGIQLDQLFIPTDPIGQMLIPFRGPSHTFPYISATDVLNGSVAKEALEGKIVIIGTTASVIGDIRPVAIASEFPGIEINASIIAGIIDRYLPYKPTWGRGVTILLMFIFGSIYAIVLPFLGVFRICILCIILPFLFVLGNFFVWRSLGIVISTMLPILLILLLFLVNIIWGYLFEARCLKEMKLMFGQYVPPVYFEEMIKNGGEFSLEGESKELSVLFSDIRSFSDLSEKLSASEVKQFLNRYFSPITEIIFNYKGTIDKYVGDMVMAFWGAPLADPRHAFNAVSTGMAMQEELNKLNAAFLSEKKPAIHIGVGINTGMMNVGDMGSKFRRAYTVLGDAVNLASRLEGQTKYYHVGVLVGEQTYYQTKNDFVYQKIDQIKVKGKDKAVAIFTPLCTSENATDEIKKELDIHHQALEAYFHQRWDDAEALFLSIQKANPELYAVYLERIKFFRANPPGPNWEGIYVSLEK